MATSQSLAVRSFHDRAEALGHFVLRAGESPRLLACDDVVGCPVDTAVAALEWTGAVGLLLDDDLIHAGRLTAETAAALIERRLPEGGRQYIYLGPRLDAPMMDLFEGKLLFEEPGVKAVEFVQRGHALGHFFRATGGEGALLAMLGRRAPEVRHLRRWFAPIVKQLEGPSQLVAGWFAAAAGGALFALVGGSEPEYRYIEVGLEP